MDEQEADPHLYDPEEFYDLYGHREWERLEANVHGRLEFEGTVEYLERYLPESGRVLDAGGAAGRYSVWLAERGYDVTLVDISDRQREIAREKVAEHGVVERVDVAAGDIRDLRFDDGAFDATLCTGGPISHIIEESERRTAAGELHRVTAADGPVFVSVMGLLNVLQIFTTTKRHLRALPQLAETGDFTAALLAEHDDSSRFAEVHFFRAAELADLLEGAGFDVERIVGLEGTASLFADDELREGMSSLSDEQVASIETVVERTREDEAVADLSSHILAVCRASPGAQ